MADLPLGREVTAGRAVVPHPCGLSSGEGRAEEGTCGRPAGAGPDLGLRGGAALTEEETQGAVGQCVRCAGSHRTGRTDGA